MNPCQGIEEQLNASIELRKEIVENLHRPDLTPEERAQLIRDLKDINPVIARLKKDLENCQNPRLPQPDLVAVGFLLVRAGEKMSLAGIIRNDGDGPAYGPFKVTLGAAYLDVSRSLEVQIPNSVTIEGFGTEYQTPEAIENIPLLDYDVDPRNRYRFDMLVDPDRQISERIESNNSLSIDYWTRR